jgi:hypothetical protein
MKRSTAVVVIAPVTPNSSANPAAIGSAPAGTRPVPVAGCTASGW